MKFNQLFLVLTVITIAPHLSKYYAMGLSLIYLILAMHALYEGQ